MPLLAPVLSLGLLLGFPGGLQETPALVHTGMTKAEAEAAIASRFGDKAAKGEPDLLMHGFGKPERLTYRAAGLILYYGGEGHKLCWIKRLGQ